MARTAAESREYSRGYQRGRARMQGYADYAFRVARSFRDQAAVLRRSILGGCNWTSRECQNCERWTRGGEGCRWGTCSADFLAQVGEPMMWTNGGQIFTHQDFVCCSHLAANPLRAANAE